MNKIYWNQTLFSKSFYFKDFFTWRFLMPKFRALFQKSFLYYFFCGYLTATLTTARTTPTTVFFFKSNISLVFEQQFCFNSRYFFSFKAKNEFNSRYVLFRQVEKLPKHQREEFYRLTRKQGLLEVSENLLKASGICRT